MLSINLIASVSGGRLLRYLLAVRFVYDHRLRVRRRRDDLCKIRWSSRWLSPLIWFFPQESLKGEILLGKEGMGCMLLVLCHA